MSFMIRPLAQSLSYCSRKIQQITKPRKFSSTRTIVIQKQNGLFTEEQVRQREAVGRLEKIEVRYLGNPKDVGLVMNRSISTPFNCAQHLSDVICKTSALALIDGNTPWDMHRPLEESCTLQLLNFMVAEPHLLNKAFWRTCSFMLGAALQDVFKDGVCQLHSFPSPNIKSGSFVHDIVLRTTDWKPSEPELRAISAKMMELSLNDLKIERLEVSHELALEMFKDFQYKYQQLPSISEQNRGRVILYRMGSHIDISRGPLVGSSRFLGKCTVASGHKIADEGNESSLYRIQGVALPKGLVLNHIAYETLERRARKLNTARIANETLEQPYLGVQ